jgi:type II secretory pathway predicted ATPase ExeA
LQNVDGSALGPHHLKLVDRSDALFRDDAITLIHQVSRGLPRAVNNLAVQALVAAYATTRRHNAPAETISNTATAAATAR